jgi:hypothetical protein
MLDKFRDLSFSTKIALAFGAVFAAIGLLIGLGLGIKAIIAATSEAPLPSNTITHSATPTTTPIPNPSPSPSQGGEDVSNPYAPSSKEDEASLIRGFNIVTSFVTASCQIKGGASYSNYTNGIKKYLSPENNVSIMDETTFKSIKNQSCEILAGQPEEQLDKNKYKASVMVEIKTSYNGVKAVNLQSVTYDATMIIINKKWYVYDVSVG